MVGGPCTQRRAQDHLDAYDYAVAQLGLQASRFDREELIGAYLQRLDTERENEREAASW